MNPAGICDFDSFSFQVPVLRSSAEQRVAKAGNSASAKARVRTFMASSSFNWLVIAAFEPRRLYTKGWSDARKKSGYKSLGEQLRIQRGLRQPRTECDVTLFCSPE